MTSVYVTLDQTREKLVPRNIGEIFDESKDLVYLELSPDYCTRDSKHGTLGVAGRRCEKHVYEAGGCSAMCCGLGLQTKKVF